MSSIQAGITEIVTLPAPKGPSDTLMYRMDWTHFLSPMLDTISSSVWESNGLISANPAIEAGNLAATVWLSGGTAGGGYTVTNTVTTTAGRTVARSFRLNVAER
ncbi:MAG: hypothetical protein ACE5FN_08395 [Leptospirillia bacterium]